jgi:hypothetical protein
MKIINLSYKASTKEIKMYLTIILFFLLPMYIFVNISWTPAEMPQIYFMLFMLFILLLGFLISAIVKRVSELELLHYKSPFKYVEFLANKINFYVTSQNVISYQYQDIDKLEMELHTERRYGHSGAVHSYVVYEIRLLFTFSNGERITIYSIPSNIKCFICELLYFVQNIKVFSYKFVGEIDHIAKEILEHCIQTGYMQVLTTQRENRLKLISLMLFASSLAGFPFLSDISTAIHKSNYTEAFMLSIPILIFWIISALIDGFMIWATLNDKKHGIKHGNSLYINNVETVTNVIAKIPLKVIVWLKIAIIIVLIIWI